MFVNKQLKHSLCRVTSEERENRVPYKEWRAILETRSTAVLRERIDVQRTGERAVDEASAASAVGARLIRLIIRKGKYESVPGQNISNGKWRASGQNAAETPSGER